MFLFLDTTNSDLAIAFFNKKYQLIDYIIEKNIKQKAEILPNLITKLLNKNNLKIENLTKIFCNLGPGSFTGVRIGLIFSRTLCQLNSNIEFYSTNSFQIISLISKNTSCIQIDARSKQCYTAQIKNHQVKSGITVETCENVSNLNEEHFLNLFNNFIHHSHLIFQKEKELLKLEPLYIKQPHIGINKKSEK